MHLETKTKNNWKYLILLAVIGLAFWYFRPITSQAEEYIFNGNLDAANQDIWQINQDINNKRSEIQELQKQIEVYKKNISAKQRTLANLSGQMNVLNDSIAQTNLEIAEVKLEIESANLQIANAELQILAKEKEIDQQKQNISELIRSLHRYQQKSSVLEILLLNDNFSDFMADIDRLEIMQNKLVAGVADLEKIKSGLLDDKQILEDSQQELVVLNERLDTKKADLGSQKIVKIALLQETEGQEAKFQQLLNQAKEEQEQTNADIVYLEKVAREKLNRQLEAQEMASDGYMWPVPGREITAFFHDPDYPYRHIFEHPAVDIRAAQGTPIKAVSSGYVAKTKDGGAKGYSYIMLVHTEGISTVYGHVNRISVSEDQFVTKGQIIGYSGGMPGTSGAGLLTTGPHLHLEFRLNGIPVNPANYLP